MKLKYITKRLLKLNKAIVQHTIPTIYLFGCVAFIVVGIATKTGTSITVKPIESSIGGDAITWLGFALVIMFLIEFGRQIFRRRLYKTIIKQRQKTIKERVSEVEHESISNRWGGLSR